MGNCCLYSKEDQQNRSSLSVKPRFEICIKSSRKVSSCDRLNFNDFGIIREEIDEEADYSPNCCGKYKQSYSTSHQSHNMINWQQPFKLQNTLTNEYLTENLNDQWLFQFEQENIVKLYDPKIQLYYCDGALYEVDCEDEYICYNSVVSMNCNQVELKCKDNSQIQGILNLYCDHCWRIIEMQ